MRILLGISMLVLAAILWTGVSILRHIRLTRRRNAFLRDQQNSQQVQALPMRALSGVTPLPARFAAPLAAHAPDAEDLADLAYLESLAKTAPRPVEAMPLQAIQFPALRPAVVEARPQPVVVPQPVLAPVDVPLIVAPVEAPRVAAVLQEPSPLRIMEFVPESAARDIFPSAPAFPALAAVPPPSAVAPPPPMASNQRRPVRSVHSQSSSRPAHRPDWIYFNKDMGDLSDPAPSRIRVRSR